MANLNVALLIKRVENLQIIVEKLTLQLAGGKGHDQLDDIHPNFGQHPNPVCEKHPQPMSNQQQQQPVHSHQHHPHPMPDHHQQLPVFNHHQLPMHVQHQSPLPVQQHYQPAHDHQQRQTLNFHHPGFDQHLHQHGVEQHQFHQHGDEKQDSHPHGDVPLDVRGLATPTHGSINHQINSDVKQLLAINFHHQHHHNLHDRNIGPSNQVDEINQQSTPHQNFCLNPSQQQQQLSIAADLKPELNPVKQTNFNSPGISLSLPVVNLNFSLPGSNHFYHSSTIFLSARCGHIPNLFRPDGKWCNFRHNQPKTRACLVKCAFHSIRHHYRQQFSSSQPSSIVAASTTTAISSNSASRFSFIKISSSFLRSFKMTNQNFSAHRNSFFAFIKKLPPDKSFFSSLIFSWPATTKTSIVFRIRRGISRFFFVFNIGKSLAVIQFRIITPGEENRVKIRFKILHFQIYIFVFASSIIHNQLLISK